jgi:hypothetical protein
MAAIGMVVGGLIRRRVGRTLSLVLLVRSGGAVLATTAGARRTRSCVDSWVGGGGCTDELVEWHLMGPGHGSSSWRVGRPWPDLRRDRVRGRGFTEP